jgi:Bacterial protein of unknown function (DUF839)
MRRSRRLLAVCGLTTITVAAAAAAAIAGDNQSGFKTSSPAMLTGVATGSSVEAIITVGDTLPGHYRFESIPDGISLRARGQGRLDLYVNHETSRVPFPYNPLPQPPEANQNDFDNAQVSMLSLNQHSAGVLKGEMVITSASNFQRFCSNYLATAAEGFDRELLFTNEEATDFVFRSGEAWPAAASDPGAEQAGVVVAYDVKRGVHKPIYGMGRHNHENSVAIPGFDDLVVLSGDDTFTSNPAQSQLYAYIAPDADAVWNDQGSLYGFKVDNAAINDYYDVPVGSSASYPGHFVPIPRAAAVGDQTALENASDTAGVFQFVRLEDVAYDKRPGMSNVVYVADTGRGNASASGNAFASTNGRIWKLEFTDPDDPTEATLSLLVEGDDAALKTPGEIHQPDNVETTAAGSLMVTEDPGSTQQFPPGSDVPGSPNFDPTATTARLWRVDLDAATPDSAKTIAAKVDQSADEGPTDVDAASKGSLGAWESSGVVDASAYFGPGAFFVTIQASTLWLEKQTIAPEDDPGPLKRGFTNKRSGGQLVLVRIPGA